MKFTDGQWLNKQNHLLLHPQQTFDAVYENNILTVYVYTKMFDNRAFSLDQATITFHFSSEQKNTITVEENHFEGIRQCKPVFECYKDETVVPSYEETDDSYIYSSGLLKAVIKKCPFEISYYYGNKLLTKSYPKAIASVRNDKSEYYMREQLSLSVGEYVYGLGERFTPYLKNGQVVEMWNEDGGTASEISYKNIPFYITNKNYGVFVRNTGKVSFEVASEHVERVQFSIPGHKMCYTILGANNMGEVIQNYTSLTGKPALPPPWSFGLWLSTSFTTSYDEETVTSFIGGMFEREIPMHVFHFDCFWMSECEWCNLEWDSVTFPDPINMIKRLKQKGLKICVWINPYIAQKSKLFKEGMENHYLLEYENGDVWQWDRWQAGMGIVDFTNPEAYKWYQDKLKILLDMGVDCFKTDFGERIPTNVRYHDGSNPVNMHNYYTYIYNKCVFDLLKREKGENEAILFARSATAGSQQFPVHWGGDCWGTYESMSESLRGGLSLCMSGFGFWSHDIGGFEKTSTPDIYKRWVAFGLLSTHSRLHGSSSYRVPWNFDEESVDVLRFFTQLKCSLMPYLWEQAIFTSRTGYPMLRSMIMEFSDTACKFIDTQYMLGKNILVAPIFNEEGIGNYYLPEGLWTNLLTGETKEGGSYFEEKYDYFSLPLYVKQNAIIPISKNKIDIEYDYAKNVELHITPFEDGHMEQCIIYDNRGYEKLIIEVSKKSLCFQIVINKAEEYSFTFHLHGVDDVNNIKGGTFTKNKNEIIINPNNNISEITFNI